MKKLAIKIFLLICVLTPAFAQEDEPAVSQDPKARARLDAARAAFITERLGLTADEAEKFWPIYREFANKRQGLHQQLRSARQEGKTDNELVELGLSIKQKELDLEKEYSGQMMRVISAQKLMNLRPAEREFTRIIIQQIQQRQQQQDRRQQMRERQEQRLQQRNN